MARCEHCDKVLDLRAEDRNLERVWAPHIQQFRYLHRVCPTIPEKDIPMNLDQIMGSVGYVQRRALSQTIMASGREFFIVYNPNSDKPPTLAFEEEAEAFQLAEKMARKFPDEQFFVLRTVGFAQTQQPVVVSKFHKEVTMSTNPHPKRVAAQPKKR